MQRELQVLRELLQELLQLQVLPQEQVLQELYREQIQRVLRVQLQVQGQWVLQLLRVSYHIHRKKLRHRDSLFRN